MLQYIYNEKSIWYSWFWDPGENFCVYLFYVLAIVYFSVLRIHLQVISVHS